MSQLDILMNLIIKHYVFKLKSRHAKRLKFDFRKKIKPYCQTKVKENALSLTFSQRKLKLFYFY